MIEGQHLFDITAVVGSVYSGGTIDPYVVAFTLIGEFGAPGTFTFPSAAGGVVTVTVDVSVPAEPVEPVRKSRAI